MANDLLDPIARKLIHQPLDAIARMALAVGLTANRVSILGFVIGVGAWGALAIQAHTIAACLIILNRFADGVDGAIARRVGPTDLGGYLDITLDFLFYAGVPFFFAVGIPEQAIPASFLIFSFVGTGSSFLAFAVIAAKRGITTERRGKKAIYYLGGLTEGTETIACFLLLCLLPSHFALIAWTFGGLCWLTTAFRIAEGFRQFRQ